MAGLEAAINGMVWKLGDHVNTDLIHPPSHFSLETAAMGEGLREGMKRLDYHPREGVPPKGLVMVGGENLGCGSSRETTVRALAQAGVRAVVAKSFARIFYRSLANLGIPPLVCGEAHDHVKTGDNVRVWVFKGVLQVPGERRLKIQLLDDHIRKILRCGGLIPYLRSEAHGI
jgi:3-isopropylmalate dehydratase small subunit